MAINISQFANPDLLIRTLQAEGQRILSGPVCIHCGADNLRDYPLCTVCAPKFCSPYRTNCQAINHRAECKTLALQETVRVFADDPPRLADFLSDRMAA